jgi:hypothetical protein
MGWETITVRKIEDAEGTISFGHGPDIPVRFDLTETEDTLNGAPCLKLGLGNIRYGPEFEPIILALIPSREHPVLRGIGVEIHIVLYGSGRFTSIQRS